MNAWRGQRWWWRAAKFVVLVYVSAAAFAWWAADRLMFHPDHGSRRAPPGEVKITAEEGRELSAIYLSNPTARFTIWYFHGNAEDLGNLAPMLWAMHDAGFAVFAYDYPGYGRSGGSPSERSIFAATRAALDYLRRAQAVLPERIVLYGTSLGGGAATELAVREPVAGLVLQSAFTSAYRVMTRWPLLPFDRFANLRKLPAVRCPVLVIHGDADEVVPFYHGEALYAAAPGRKTFVRVKAAGHHDLWSRMGDDYWRVLRTFTDSL